MLHAPAKIEAHARLRAGPCTTHVLARALGSDWVWARSGSGLVPFGLGLGSLSWTSRLGLGYLGLGLEYSAGFHGPKAGVLGFWVIRTGLGFNGLCLA